MVFFGLLIFVFAAAANSLLAWAIGVPDTIPRDASALELSQTPAAHAVQNKSAQVALFPVFRLAR